MQGPEPSRNPASFRDPYGYVFHYKSNVFRSLNPEASAVVSALFKTKAYAALYEKHLIIGTRLADKKDLPDFTHDETNGSYLRHEKLWFQNYPHEWTFGMLRDAALCTLKVQEILLGDSYSLKDASAYNVHFDVTDTLNPVFIDIASIEPMPGGLSGAWIPYRQFLSNFVLPLCFSSRKGLPHKLFFVGDMDGLTPETAYRMLGPMEKVSPPYFGMLTLPLLLGRSSGRAKSEKTIAPSTKPVTDKEVFIAQNTVKSLGRSIKNSAPKHPYSEWTNYQDTSSYSAEANATKESFIKNAVAKLRPGSVMDIGCNTGKYSFIAAEAGAKVLALDSDMPSLDLLYERIKKSGVTILPLCIDIANPTPSTGWLNKERQSFLERVEAFGKFEMVFALALVHHLLLRSGIPISEIVQLLDAITGKYLLLELVGPSDPMWKTMSYKRESLFGGLSIEAQALEFKKSFNFTQELSIAGMDRKLFLLEKRA